MRLEDWRPFQVVEIGPDRCRVRGERTDGDETEVWTVCEQSREDAQVIADALNGLIAPPPGPPLTRSQFEAFCAALYLADGRRLAPIATWLAARVPEWHAWHLPIDVREARLALANELRRLAVAVLRAPDSDF